MIFRTEIVLLLRDMRVYGSVIGESITANLDYMRLDNQSHDSLDAIEFRVTISHCLWIP